MATPCGQRLLDLAHPRLHAVDDAQRVLAEPHDDDAADGLALAVELRDASPQVRPEATCATSPTRTGVPRSLAPSATCSMSPTDFR